jgi:hypothetical protein
MLQTAIEVALYKAERDRQVEYERNKLSTILQSLGEGVIVADIRMMLWDTD